MENIKNKFMGNCILSQDEEESCYELCSYKVYYDEINNQYKCTKNNKCPETHQKLIREKNICVKSCIETIENKNEYNNVCLEECPQYFYNLPQKPNYCFPSCPEDRPFLLIESLRCVLNCTIIERQNKLCITGYMPKNKTDYNAFDKIISQTKYELKNNFNELVVNGNPIEENGAKIIITKTDNQNNNEDVDINFGNCETELKLKYNINLQESLYLLRIDVEQEGMKTDSYEYELYYPLNRPNLEKLDISLYCQGSKINITKKVNLTHDIKEHNASSNYYNDICYISDSNNNYDICLKDKRNNYVKKNMSICEINCDFISYNYETQKAVCSCDIKTEIPFMKNIKFDKKLLMNKFIDINNIANIKMIFCYKNIFKIKRLLKNYGCFIFISFIIFNIVLIFLFYFLGYNLLIKDINTIKNFVLYNNQLSKNKIKNTINNKKTKKNVKRNKKINTKKNNNKKLIRNITEIKRNKNIKNNNKFKNTTNVSIINIKGTKIFNDESNKKFRKKKLRINKINKNNNISLNYSELNSLSYKIALIKDKRTFTQYYISLLKTNHILLFIFYSRDYNSKLIKISIFLFSLSSFITVNALFFNDSSMHKIYIDKGSYNIIYQLPQILYSTVISTVINKLINLLGLSENKILEFKKTKTSIKAIDKIYIKIVKILKIKFSLFFVTIFILLLIFGYYIVCFCGIYKNTQYHLLKDSLFSFITTLITPFFKYLIPGILRVLALKRKSKIIYNFSKILQLLL